MPKPKPPESYETQGNGYVQANDRNALIQQVSSEIARDKPSGGVRVSFQGEDVIVRYHCVERLLDDRTRVEALTKESEKFLKGFVKELKSEYRKRSGSTISMTEIKDRRNYTIQKVSLNGSFYFVYQQVFSLS